MTSERAAASSFPPEILDRYLAGVATPAERAAVEAWLKSDSKAQRFVSAVSAAVGQGGFGGDAPVDVDALLATVHERRPDISARPNWQALETAIDAEVIPWKNDSVRGRLLGDRRLGQGLVRRTPRNRLAYALSATAVAVLVTGIAIRHVSQASQTLRVRTYAIRAGQRATVTLPHGERAIIGPATTLSVVASTTSEETRVAISGQALFMIPSHARHAFIVTTRNAQTRVLGTAFWVRRYGNDRTTHVAVVDGRVALQAISGGRVVGQGTVLAAGVYGMVSDSGHITVIQDGTVGDLVAWTDGRLVFNRTPAHEVVVELGRVYGVTIRLGDSTLSQRRLTWTVPVARQTLPEVLDALTTALQAHITSTHGVMTVVPGPAPIRKPIRTDTSPIPDAPESSYGK